MPDNPAGRLELSRAEMEDLGRRVMESVVERWAGLREQPLGRIASPTELEKQLAGPPPELGADPLEVLRQVYDHVLGNTISIDHPRFLAFIPVPSNFIGFLADVLASGFNVFAGTWLAGSGAAQVELTTIDWLRRLCGFPDGAQGLFVSGGSMANLTALVAARHAMLGEHDPDSRVYFSDQTHSSVQRALTVMGFSPRQWEILPSDADFRLGLPSLQKAVAAHRASGKRPFCVVANGGTTNTGAVDPLPELVSFCREEGLWLHVDGAYGAPAMLCDEGKALLDGMGDADSLTMDPHKWLFQPMELGCVILREGRFLAEAFRVTPEYMKDVEGEINFADSGIQLTRGFRALKLWMSLKIFGLGAFRNAVSLGIKLGKQAEKRIRASSHFELVTPAQLGILTFRYKDDGRPSHELDALNRAITDALRKEGRAMLSTTALRGRTVLRMCTNNPRTTKEDIEETVALLEKWADVIGGQSSGHR